MLQHIVTLMKLWPRKDPIAEAMRHKRGMELWLANGRRLLKTEASESRRQQLEGFIALCRERIDKAEDTIRSARASSGT